MERDDDKESYDTDRWLVVDVGTGRYLGKVLQQEDVCKPSKPLPKVMDPSVPLTDGPELILENVVSIQMLNVPTREGIAVQGVPSSPVPWYPPFACEMRVRIPLAHIRWYDDVDPDVVAKLRAALLAASGGPRPVGIG